jgi:hypothetical protein
VSGWNLLCDEMLQTPFTCWQQEMYLLFENPNAGIVQKQLAALFITVLKLNCGNLLTETF